MKTKMLADFQICIIVPLTSNVATMIQINIKYCVKLEVKVLYGKSGDFTLYNLKIGKI